MPFPSPKASPPATVRQVPTKAAADATPTVLQRWAFSFGLLTSSVIDTCSRYPTSEVEQGKQLCIALAVSPPRTNKSSGNGIATESTGLKLRGQRVTMLCSYSCVSKLYQRGFSFVVSYISPGRATGALPASRPTWKHTGCSCNAQQL